ncbi:MAG: cysteine desulfurase [Clostridia bacterium]|nr:cysteine desulfurase [Clostridia bacterium]
MKEIYLDNAATTAVIPEALSAAENAMQVCYGNAGSVHDKGRQAGALLNECRKTVAAAMGVDSGCVTFTSGGTESINTALRGAAFKNKHLGKHIITSAVEHDATLNTLRSLEQEGFEVTVIAPEKDGSVSLEKIVSAIREDTILMSLMGVCNETGAFLPYAEAAAELKKRNSKALFHLDAVQLFCKAEMDLKNVDFCSVSAHKIGALKGSGALYIKKGLVIRPLIYGGGQESGMRSGTEAIPQIAAFAAAAKKRSEALSESIAHYGKLKKLLLDTIKASGVYFELNTPENSSGHIINISPCKLRSEVLIRILSDKGIYVSGGSACARGKKSHVLSAMKVSPKNIDAALRVSFCPETSDADVLAFCDAFAKL